MSEPLGTCEGQALLHAKGAGCYGWKEAIATNAPPPTEMVSLTQIKSRLSEIELSLGSINTNLCTVAESQGKLYAAIHGLAGATAGNPLALSLDERLSNLGAQLGGITEGIGVAMADLRRDLTDPMATQSKLLAAYNRGVKAGRTSGKGKRG